MRVPGRRRHTVLRHRVAELEKTHWKRMVFVLDDSLGPLSKVEDLRRRYGAVKVEHVQPRTWKGETGDAFTVATVSPYAGEPVGR